MPPEGITVICPESASGSRNAITAGCQLSPAESQGLPQGPAQHPTTAITVCADADSGLRNSSLSCSTDYLFRSFFPHVTPAFAQVSSPATLILQRRITAGERRLFPRLAAGHDAPFGTTAFVVPRERAVPTW